jgi:hypothetical protein
MIKADMQNSWSMTGASNPKFARKNLELNLINKAPLKHAHDDEVSCPSETVICS